MFHAYFIADDGEILKSVAAWSSLEEAVLRAKAVLARPEHHVLYDEDDKTVTGARIDCGQGFTIESE